MIVEFTVEHAGCASCAELVRTSLSVLGAVERIDIDEASDVARVRLVPAREVTTDEVDDLLADASEGSGHGYRVAPGSWAWTS